MKSGHGFKVWYACVRIAISLFSGSALASFPGRFFTNRTPGEKYGLVLIVFGRVCRDRKIHSKTFRKNTH